MIIGSASLQAVAQKTSFTATYGGARDDYAAVVQPLGNQDYLIAGWTNSFGAGNADIWLLRLDYAGRPIWQKTIGGGQDDYASAMLQASTSQFFVAGGTASFGAGGLDAWVMQVSAAGDQILWQKAYGGANDDYAEAIVATADGGLLVAGWTESFGSGDRDLWLLKLDLSGNILWQKTYGGASFDSLSSIQPIPGGYIISGETMSSDSGTSDILLLKLDNNGGIIGQFAYNVRYQEGGTVINGADAARALQVASDGYYIVAGETGSRIDEQNIFTMRVDPSGVDPRSETLHKAENMPSNAYAIRPTSDGGFMLGGWNDALLLSKFDKYDKVLWQYGYNGAMYEYLSSLDFTPDGGYIIGGATNSFGALEDDMFILKLDATCTPGQCAIRQNSSLQSSSALIWRQSLTLTVQAPAGRAMPTTAILTSTSVSPKYICPLLADCAAGDLDCNGKFNIFDLQRLVNCIFAGGSCANGDMNGDGKYNIFDVQQLINKIFIS